MFDLLNLKFASSANIELLDVTNEHGEKLTPQQLRETASSMLVLADQAKDVEMAKKLTPNQLYWYRSRRGVKYVSFKELNENGLPLVFDADRYGVQKDGAYEFAFPVERLNMVKR